MDIAPVVWEGWRFAVKWMKRCRHAREMGEVPCMRRFFLAWRWAVAEGDLTSDGDISKTFVRGRTAEERRLAVERRRHRLDVATEEAERLWLEELQESQELANTLPIIQRGIQEKRRILSRCQPRDDATTPCDACGPCRATIDAIYLTVAAVVVATRCTEQLECQARRGSRRCDEGDHRRGADGRGVPGEEEQGG